jgi:hypothetical protein
MAGDVSVAWCINHYCPQRMVKVMLNDDQRMVREIPKPEAA